MHSLWTSLHILPLRQGSPHAARLGRQLGALPAIWPACTTGNLQTHDAMDQQGINETAAAAERALLQSLVPVFRQHEAIYCWLKSSIAQFSRV